MVVQARTLYTDARRINFGWPESLPISFEKRWKERLHSLKFLKNIKIDRCLRERESDDRTQFQVSFFFADAFNLTKGAVCCMKLILPDFSIASQLIIAKAHICE